MSLANLLDSCRVYSFALNDMVKRKDSLLQTADSISIASWLEQINSLYSLEQLNLIKRACHILQELTEKEPPETANKLRSSLQIADTLAELNLDHEVLIAAILYEPLIQTKISLEQIKTEFNPTIGKLLEGVLQLNNIRDLQNKTDKNRALNQVDKLRKMLVAMVDDVRVVLIKLAERLSTLRLASQFEDAKRRAIAQEVPVP